MKANEFVRKYGLDKAKFIHLRCIVEKKGLAVAGVLVDIGELGRLVESHEIIQSRGGMNRAKNTAILLQSSIDIGLYHGMDGVDANVELPLLKQAIADVESCQ